MCKNLLSPSYLTQQLPNEPAAHTYLIGAIIPLLCDVFLPGARAVSLLKDVLLNLLGKRQRDMTGCNSCETIAWSLSKDQAKTNQDKPRGRWGIEVPATAAKKMRENVAVSSPLIGANNPIL